MSIRFRTGKVGAGGGKPFVPLTKTWKAKTSSGIAYPTSTPDPTPTTAGCVIVLPVHEPNLPFKDAQTNRVTAEVGLCTIEDPLVHPTGQKEAFADGYRVARVISANYVLKIWAKDAGAAGKDFILAWKFHDTPDTSDYTMVTAAGSPGGARRQWHDIRMSKAWQHKRFSSTQAGGSIYPCAREFTIRVPSVGKLSMAFADLDGLQADSITDPLRLALHAGTAFGTAPQHPLYLHILVFNIDRNSMDAHAWIGDIDLYQKIMVFKEEGSAEMVDEMDVGA